MKILRQVFTHLYCLYATIGMMYYAVAVLQLRFFIVPNININKVELLKQPALDRIHSRIVVVEICGGIELLHLSIRNQTKTYYIFDCKWRCVCSLQWNRKVNTQATLHVQMYNFPNTFGRITIKLQKIAMLWTLLFQNFEFEQFWDRQWNYYLCFWLLGHKVCLRPSGTFVLFTVQIIHIIGKSNI